MVNQHCTAPWRMKSVWVCIGTKIQKFSGVCFIYCKFVAGSEQHGNKEETIVKGVKYWIDTLIHQFMYEYQIDDHVEKLSEVNSCCTMNCCMEC